MVRQIVTTLVLCAATASAFVSTFTPSNQLAVAARRHACAPMYMGGASGKSSTRAGKAETVAGVRELLASSTFIFAIQSSQVKGLQVTALRKALPPSTTARVVKNKLLRIAAADTPFAAVEGDLTKGENMWFFVKDDMKETLEIVKKFAKDIQKIDTHMPRYGVIDGQKVDAAGIEKLASLPSKKELYQRIAYSIQAVPTKIARGINLVPTKIARGVKLALVDGKDGKDGAAAPADDAAAAPAEPVKEAEAASVAEAAAPAAEA